VARLQNVMPFVVLFFLKYIYQHAIGGYYHYYYYYYQYYYYYYYYDYYRTNAARI